MQFCRYSSPRHTLLILTLIVHMPLPAHIHIFTIALLPPPSLSTALHPARLTVVLCSLPNSPSSHQSSLFSEPSAPAGNSCIALPPSFPVALPHSDASELKRT